MGSSAVELIVDYVVHRNVACWLRFIVRPFEGHAHFFFLNGLKMNQSHRSTEVVRGI